jgi:hypothetical protein
MRLRRWVIFSPNFYILVISLIHVISMGLGPLELAYRVVITTAILAARGYLRSLLLIMERQTHPNQQTSGR